MDKISRYENVDISYNEVLGHVTIECSLGEDVDAQPSASGKTLVYSTTGGMAPIPGAPGFQVNFTVCKKR